jgi:putative ABC transport system substrate-binding protein
MRSNSSTLVGWQLPSNLLRRAAQAAMSLLLGTFPSVIPLIHADPAWARDAGAPAKVGEIWMSNPHAAAFYREPFRAGLRELGYKEGANIQVIALYAGGDVRRIPGLVDELIAQNVDVMLVIGLAIPFAREKAPSIPIVCPSFFDPISEGFVTSLARPGGNLTGLSWQSSDSSGKRVELGTQLVPDLKRLGVIFADTDRGPILDASRTEEAAKRLGLRVKMYPFRDARSLDEQLAAVLKDRPPVLIAVDSSLAITHRERIASFATKSHIALISEGRHWTDAGAVLAYGPNAQEIYRRAATYVDRILKGAKPGDLPIEHPNKFELLVNRRSAEAISLKVPESILLRADEVMH